MGYRVKEIREKKNMTQEELEARSGISRQTISAIETGKAGNVTVATLRALANGLETSISDLFFEEAV